MATITGITSANKTKYSYYITWSETDVNVANNTSLVTANVYVKKISDYKSQSSSNPHDLWIDGTKFSDNNAIDMNPETTPRLCVSGSKTVTHSANGSKSINISSSGTLPSGDGYGPVSGSASATVALTTIPREAYITNSVSFVIGNSIPITLVNAGLQYVQALTYVNGTLIKTQNLGQVTSGTLTFSAGEISNMYAEIPSATSCSMFVRIKTYSDSGYTTQIGSSRDQTGTASINTATNVPTFTTWAVANVDKNIVVKDKYENTLITSSTSTLLGADTKALSGYSKVRATITSANKAVALNSATMSKYRFVAGSKYTEANYSADSTVTIDIDSVTTGSYLVVAQDSRSLTTSVAGSLALISPTPVSLWNLKLERANGVDQAVTMSFSGSMWKEYFGGGTAGVQNAVVCEWRYKETSQAWGSQSWTAITGDLTIDNVGNISYEDGIGNFDTDKSYSVEVRMYDKVSQVLIEGIINVGIPVMDITKDGVAFMGKYDSGEGGSLQVYGKSILNLFYPVGTIYETTSTDLNTTTKMGNHFGGTWEEYGAGRVLVAKSADTEFDTIGETGGAKEITLSSGQSGLPAHTHMVYPLTTGSGDAYVQNKTGSNASSPGATDGSVFLGIAAANTAANASQAHSNLQPYIVVYRYRRTA